MTVVVKENWKKVVGILKQMKNEWLFDTDKTLLSTRMNRRNDVELYIRTMPLLITLQPSRLPHNGRTWASDGSMVLAMSGLGDLKSVTAALTGPNTAVLRLSDRNISILQGKLMGLIMGLILSSTEANNASIHSDHMNSVCLIEDSRSSISQENQLRNMNGHSYYRWIFDLAKENRTIVTYTKGHSKEVTLASQLNSEADYYASRLQNVASSVHPAPNPTFYMDEYTFYRPVDGWIESNIRTFMEHFLFKSTSDELATGHRYQMATWLYDQRPPPTYPYIRAMSAYTALVQLYVRLGQLPTAEGMVQKGQSRDKSCRMGCMAIKDMHHIFVDCPKYSDLRKEAEIEVVKRTIARIQAFEIEEAGMTSLLRIAKSLFIDCIFMWPLHYSFFYLGHIPPMDSHVPLENFKSRIQQDRFMHNIKSDWHLSSIRLASRIYGQLQKEMARRRDLQEKKNI